MTHTVRVVVVRSGKVLIVRDRRTGVGFPAAAAENEHGYLHAMREAVASAGMRLLLAGPGLGTREVVWGDREVVYQATADGVPAPGPGVEGAWWGDPAELLWSGAAGAYTMALAAVANDVAGWGRAPNRLGEVDFRVVVEGDPKPRDVTAVPDGPGAWKVYLGGRRFFGDGDEPSGRAGCADARAAAAAVAGGRGWAVAEVRGPGEMTTAERVRLATAEAVSACQGKIQRMEWGESQGGERCGAMVECREALGLPEIVATPPRRSVVLIVERGGAFAAIRSRKYGGGVSAPGGKVEPGELVLAAAHREGREELGVSRLKVTASLGSYVHLHDGTIWECSAYVGDVEDQELTGSAEGPAEWVTREELTSGPHGAVIAKVLAAYDANVRGRL